MKRSKTESVDILGATIAVIVSATFVITWAIMVTILKLASLLIRPVASRSKWFVITGK